MRKGAVGSGRFCSSMSRCSLDAVSPRVRHAFGVERERPALMTPSLAGTAGRPYRSPTSIRGGDKLLSRDIAADAGGAGRSHAGQLLPHPAEDIAKGLLLSGLLRLGLASALGRRGAGTKELKACGFST